MISLGNTNHKQASIFFYNTVIDEVKKRLVKNKNIFRGLNTSGNHRLYDYLIDEQNLKELLKAPLDIIINHHKSELHDVFKAKYVNKRNSKVYSTFKKGINNIFFYSDHDRWKAYDILKKLDIQCCPYCNRNYITTVGNDQDKFMRADYDHFLCKSKYPYLRFSFYNLIPSCVICNQKAKKADETSLDKHIYPYNESFGQDAKFTYIPTSYDELKKGFGSIIKIKTANSNSNMGKKIEENIKLFRLNEQYSIHHRELHFILQKKSKHPFEYIDAMMKAFPQLFKSRSDAYEFIFGKSIDEKEFLHQPLAKFTKDICEQSGIIPQS